MTSASSNVAKMIEQELSKRMAIEGKGIVLGGRRSKGLRRCTPKLKCAKKYSSGSKMGKCESYERKQPKKASGLVGGDTVYSSRIPAIGSAGYVGGRRKQRQPAMDGRKKRGMIVKRVMKEKGMSLPEASHYVKVHKLY